VRPNALEQSKEGRAMQKQPGYQVGAKRGGIHQAEGEGARGVGRPVWAILVLAGSVLLSSIPRAEAATYLVRSDGTGDFPTIQAAVTAAGVFNDLLRLASERGSDPVPRDVRPGRAAALTTSRA
jgi:hypothetical protein